MIDYETLEIERDRPDYPRGLKHYSKETELENAVFDLELALYRVKCLLWGTRYEEENLPDGTEDEKEAEKVLRGICKRCIYSKRYSSDDSETS